MTATSGRSASRNWRGRWRRPAARYPRPSALTKNSQGAAYGGHIVDLHVDRDTGKVEILRYTAIQDVGTAIHPSYVEGQIQGGVAQGIGMALTEEYVYDNDGHLRNASFLDYRMPTTLDLPMIEIEIVEVPNPGHPYGVRGVGEVPIVPPMPTTPAGHRQRDRHPVLRGANEPASHPRRATERSWDRLARARRLRERASRWDARSISRTALRMSNVSSWPRPDWTPVERPGAVGVHSRVLHYADVEELIAQLCLRQTRQLMSTTPSTTLTCTASKAADSPPSATKPRRSRLASESDGQHDNCTVSGRKTTRC